MKEKNVREIRVSDYHDIYLLNQDFNPNLYLFPEEKVKEKIELITKESKDMIFVYEENNEVLGYIHGSPYELLFSESLVNVLGFVVKEKYRNQGVGSMLIERLEQWGKSHGFSGIKLLSHPSRIQAHRFYERRGYMFTKDQKNFIKNLK
ncbi:MULTISPECIES: GNAT family N-acetyltransferase [Paenibacillus]|uniref:Histone acetyltransferase n=1 Tax=Paenibacillus polymyxa TaxID=1406 RepID=A0ABX2ZGK6_PAEPO|nr:MULTISPECIES: GNAT family N-acetyltransferase [Paenibacillus]MBP1174763.1 GNAT superfamily N-acetyltransferase [Paenibacillus sp. PvR133]MCP3747146.1 GNAT family N-acetyltransferase [Paenibacillus sp. A3M_27_13]MXO77912.1 GNAT family N-acetyltransferase [Paenibacillus sp. OT2-17]ALA40798.1 histone acetyltransferase [Paenibacillus peoriae]APQ58071.1 histone acetyltransferase [Paenibacillus polymyxa]